MSGFDNESLVIVKFLKIFLDQTVLHPVLAYLAGLAVCDEFVGVEGDVKAQVVVNHYLERLAFYTFALVLVNGLCLQVALRTETVAIDSRTSGARRIPSTNAGYSGSTGGSVIAISVKNGFLNY